MDFTYSENYINRQYHISTSFKNILRAKHPELLRSEYSNFNLNSELMLRKEYYNWHFGLLNSIYDHEKNKIKIIFLDKLNYTKFIKTHPLYDNVVKKKLDRFKGDNRSLMLGILSVVAISSGINLGRWRAYDVINNKQLFVYTGLTIMFILSFALLCDYRIVKFIDNELKQTLCKEYYEMQMNNISFQFTSNW